MPAKLQDQAPSASRDWRLGAGRERSGRRVINPGRCTNLARTDRHHALAERYRDRRPDLADLCLVRMSELYPDHRVFTVDRDDFRIYRRNKREVIPLICPKTR